MKHRLLIALVILLSPVNAYGFDPIKCKSLVDLFEHNKTKLQKNTDQLHDQSARQGMALSRRLAPKYCKTKYIPGTDLYDKCILALVYTEPTYLPKGEYKSVVDQGFFDNPEKKALDKNYMDKFNEIMGRYKSSSERIKDAYYKEDCP